MLWKKGKKVKRLMEEYMHETLACLEAFQECLFALFEDSISEEAGALIEQVSDAESRADDVRSKIELKLYRKALLPEARDDILGLVEAVDHVPNWAEEVAYDIYLQRVKFPENLLGKFRHLTEMNVQCFRLLHAAVEALFSDLDAVFEKTKDVDKLESEIDALEQELIRSEAA